MPLNPKQRRFCQEYLVDLNATQAAIRAEYSAKTARQTGAENLSKPDIAAEIARRQDERSARTVADADGVVKQLAGVAFFDARKLFRPDGTMKPPSEWDADTAAAVAQADTRVRGGRRVFRFKLADRLKALELLGKHLGVFRDGPMVSVTVKAATQVNQVNLSALSDADLEAMERILVRAGQGNSAAG